MLAALSAILRILRELVSGFGPRIDSTLAFTFSHLCVDVLPNMNSWRSGGCSGSFNLPLHCLPYLGDS